MRTPAWCVRAILAVLAVFSASRAQEDTATAADTSATAPVNQLDRMVVSATRTQRRLSDVPVSVSVIGRLEIEALAARNVDDLLLSEPGVSVKRIVGMGEGYPADVIIRGVPGAYAANRLLVLVDGIPTNVASAPFMILNLIPMEAVERVELVRGPFSSLYGANAFSGVLSIVTRQNRDDAFDASVYEDFWPGAYSDAGLWSSGGIGKVGYMATGSFRWVDDVLASDSSGFGYHDQRAMARLSYWFNDDTRLTVHGRYFSGDQEYGHSRDGLEATLGNEVMTYLGGVGFSSQLGENLDLRVNAYGRKLSADYYNTAFDAIDSQRVASVWYPYTYDGRVDVQTTTKLGSWNSVTAGADYLYNTVTFSETVDRATRRPVYEGAHADIHNVGLFLQDEIALGDRINAVPGVRIDYHSDVGAVFSPKIACSYRVLDWARGRVSFGRAFRAPSMVELYMPQQTVAASTTMMPSPYLKPEYINALDGGVDLEFGPVSTTVNGFGNWMRDLITPALVPGINPGADENYVYHRNVSEAWSAGFEVAVCTRWRSFVQAKASYTFTDSWDTSLLQPLEYVPKNTASIGLQVTVPIHAMAVSGSVSQVGVGERYYMEFEGIDPNAPGALNAVGTMLVPNQTTLPSYWRTDASVRLTYRERVYLAVTGTNLADAIYKEAGNQKAPGRIVAVKVGANI